jgi:CRP-like cAMP-binding protein
MVQLSSKNVKGGRMNLFTKYTPDETAFLLNIVDKRGIKLSDDVELINVKYLKTKQLKKKDIIDKYDFIFLKSGRLAVIDKNKIIKIIKPGEVFGFIKKFFAKEFTILAIEESEVVMFDIGESYAALEKLMKYLLEKEVEKLI